MRGGHVVGLRRGRREPRSFRDDHFGVFADRRVKDVAVRRGGGHSGDDRSVAGHQGRGEVRGHLAEAVRDGPLRDAVAWQVPAQLVADVAVHRGRRARPRARQRRVSHSSGREQHARVEDGPHHQPATLRFGIVGKVVDTGILGRPDNSVETTGAGAAGPHLVGEQVFEPDPAVWTGLGERHLSRLQQPHQRGAGHQQLGGLPDARHGVAWGNGDRQPARQSGDHVVQHVEQSIGSSIRLPSAATSAGRRGAPAQRAAGPARSSAPGITPCARRGYGSLRPHWK
jgi:hypothetical protein